MQLEDNSGTTAATPEEYTLLKGEAVRYAGLNPDAYRECVEAAQIALRELEEWNEGHEASEAQRALKDALAHAQEPTA